MKEITLTVPDHVDEEKLQCLLEVSARVDLEKKIMEKVKAAKAKYNSEEWDCKEELFDFMHDFFQSI